MFTPRIVILGAGPGGLALARRLRLQGINAKLLELRPRPTPEEVQRPSGMLDLHEGTGLKVIRECSLEAEFKSALGDCSEATRVRSPSGKLLWSDEGEGSTRPEIPRASLIHLLVRSLPDSAVTWNTKVSSVRLDSRQSSTSDQTATEVVISHGKEQETRADLVIGADGAWSKTRKLLTSITPVYTGLQYITVTARNITKNYPHVLHTIGSGASFALGNGHGIMTHRGPQDSMRVYIAIRTPEEKWAEKVGLRGQSAIKVKELVLNDEKLFKNWAPELKELIEIACNEDTKDGYSDAVDVKPIYTLPRSELWPAQPEVTIIGDAAHLMAPTERVIPPAKDAAEWQKAMAPKLREYEEVMHQRATKAYEDTDELIGIMHGTDQGGEAMAAMFRSFMGGPEDVQDVVEKTKLEQ